jgi:glucose-6-phosphate isomerase
VSEVRLSLPPEAERAVRVRIARLEAEGFAARLERHDATLWSADAAHRAVAVNRLGWLDSPATMRAQTGAFRDFAAEVRGDGYTRAVLLGMGGSSLAPEVLRRSFGVAPGFLDLEVLDNTSPAAVRAVLDGDARRTLVLVSSKSGSTVEVTSFERAVWDWVGAGRGTEAGRSVVAITDPGTALESLARTRGYRRVFTNPPDIGGRYSALSCFGLVPAALLGIDLDALLDAALEENRATGGESSAERNAALVLGAALGELARAGRDKVTLILSPPCEALGDWIEQLLAESTGKDGRGLVPVVGESPASPETYGADRVFVSVAWDGGGRASARLDALRDAGHPVIEWTRRDLAAIGAEFMRWEKATAAASAVLEVDPFDEPNVSEAKQATQGLLDRFLREGTLPRPRAVAAASDVEAAAPAAVAESLRPRVADAGDPFA